MSKFVVFKDGKPILASDSKDAERLNKRMVVVDRVLKQMGNQDGADRYQEIMNDLGSNHFDKCMEFLKRVDEEAER